MNTPTTPSPSKLPNPVPTGPWKVFGIIAERLPPKDLFRFAVLVGLLRLGLAAIICFGIGRAASKPATALAKIIEQRTIEKPAPVP